MLLHTYNVFLPCSSLIILSVLTFLMIYLFLCVWMFSLHICLTTTCVQCLLRPEEGITFSGTVVIDELPIGC